MPVSNFLISGLVAYPFHQAVQLIGSTAYYYLQVPANKTDTVPCERLPLFCSSARHNRNRHQWFSETTLKILNKKLIQQLGGQNRHQSHVFPFAQQLPLTAAAF